MTDKQGLVPTKQSHQKNERTSKCLPIPGTLSDKHSLCYHFQTAFYLQIQCFILPFQSCGDGWGFHLSAKTIQILF